MCLLHSTAVHTKRSAWGVLDCFTIKIHIFMLYLVGGFCVTVSPLPKSYWLFFNSPRNPGTWPVLFTD